MRVWRFILCMASGLMKLVGGKQGLFNGSHDITFSLDYRRLDDGSSPVYGNNRWANRKDWGFCLIAFIRPLSSPCSANSSTAHFHIHVCMYWFNNNDAMNILAKPTQVTCEYLCILEMWYKVCCDLFMWWQCSAEEHGCKQEEGHTEPGMFDQSAFHQSQI